VKILSLKADGFGALRGEFRFDPDRLNLIVDENERGKSTVLAAPSRSRPRSIWPTSGASSSRESVRMTVGVCE